jgi:hypothetical protein
MESAPFDLDDMGIRPSSPIPPDLVRVYSAEVKVGKVYYIKYITRPDSPDSWLLARARIHGGDKVTFGLVWGVGSMNRWSPLMDRLNVRLAEIDSDISDGSIAPRHHLYVPRDIPTRNLAPKSAPRGLNQRKARRSRRNNSRRNRGKRN